ncbi:hypothetical protein V5735_03625 (plasmid) [Haladaptatus sp. SPP-AMP-3]|uniref:hypothetical protein n=1 Tax=Haladaptatus sp. SPP-AMP-3 TaxID=3121295 RepID=UPI003C2BF507
MSKKHIKKRIDNANPRNRSSTKQAEVVEYLYKQGASPSTTDPVRTREILDNVPSTTRTHVKNLVKGGLATEITPTGSSNFVYHERLDQYLYTDIGPAVQEEQRRLLMDLRNNPKALKVVSDDLNVKQSEVIRYLQRGGDFDQMEKLDNAIAAIERSNVSKGNPTYGRMGWRRASNKYKLTPEGMKLYQK